MLSLVPGAPAARNNSAQKMFYSNYGDLFVGLSWENSRDLLQFGNRGQVGLWVNLPESGETASIGIKDSIFLSKLDQLSINLRYRECLILALSHKKQWSASLGPSPGRSLPRLPRRGWAGVWPCCGFCAGHKHGHTTSSYRNEREINSMFYMLNVLT